MRCIIHEYQLILLLVFTMLMIGCSTLSKSKRTSIEETLKSRANTFQQVENIIEPQPMMITYTDPVSGKSTQISTPPKTSTKYSITDNNDSESDFKGKEDSKFYTGISTWLCVGFGLTCIVLFIKLTSTGKIADKIIGSGINEINNQLANSNDSKEREKLLHIKNLLDKK